MDGQRLIDRQLYRETDRQRDRNADKEIDRQTGWRMLDVNSSSEIIYSVELNYIINKSDNKINIYHNMNRCFITHL